MNRSAVSCDIESFDNGQIDALQAVTVLSAILSVFGSGFIVATYFLPQPTPSISLKIIVSLSVADLVSSFVFIIDGVSRAAEPDECGGPDSALCILCAAAAQFFGLATVLWTGCLALSLHLSVLRRSQQAADPARLYRLMCYGVYGASGASLLIMGSAGALGPSGQWCWVRLGEWWAGLLFYYLPLIAIGVYSAVVYVQTLSGLMHLHREASRNAASLGHELSRTAGAVPGLAARLRAFLLVYGLIHLSQIANRVQEIVSPRAPVFALYLLQSLLGPMQGMGNAIAYGWSPRVRRLWAARFPEWCACAVARDERSESSYPPVTGAPQLGSEVTPSGGLREDELEIAEAARPGHQAPAAACSSAAGRGAA